MDPATLAQMSPEEQAAVLQAILEGPAMEPPPGAEIDFVNKGGNSALGYGIVLTASILVGLSMLARGGSRIAIKQVHAEDGVLLAATGLFAGYLYQNYSYAQDPGMLVHQWNMQVKELSHFLYRTYVGSILYGLVVMTLKSAILLDWLRIFVPRKQRNAMFWISHALIWSNVLLYGAGTLAEIWQCTPREKIWNPLFEGGSCRVHMPSHNIASAVLNFISDLAILALPQRVIWKLHTTRRTKIGVSLLFTIGLLACACAAARIKCLVDMINSEDKVYTISIVAVWSVAEITAGFLIVGIPAIPKVAKSLPKADSMVSLLRSFKASRASSSRTALTEGTGDKARSWTRIPQNRSANNMHESEIELGIPGDEFGGVRDGTIKREVRIETSSETRPSL